MPGQRLEVWDITPWFFIGFGSRDRSGRTQWPASARHLRADRFPFSRAVSQSHGSNRESCEAKVGSDAETGAYSGHSCDIGSHERTQRRTQPGISVRTIQA